MATTEPLQDLERLASPRSLDKLADDIKSIGVFSFSGSFTHFEGGKSEKISAFTENHVPVDAIELDAIQAVVPAQQFSWQAETYAKFGNPNSQLPYGAKSAIVDMSGSVVFNNMPIETVATRLESQGVRTEIVEAETQIVATDLYTRPAKIPVAIVAKPRPA